MGIRGSQVFRGTLMTAANYHEFPLPATEINRLYVHAGGTTVTSCCTPVALLWLSRSLQQLRVRSAHKCRLVQHLLGALPAPCSLHAGPCTPSGASSMHLAGDAKQETAGKMKVWIRCGVRGAEQGRSGRCGSYMSYSAHCSTLFLKT